MGGSYYVEKLTDDIERGAREYIARIDGLGGTLAAIEQGFIQGEIQNAAYAYQQAVERGETVVVGVNRFQQEEGHPHAVFRLDPELERQQVERLRELRASRDCGVCRTSARRTGSKLPAAPIISCRRLSRRARRMGRSVRFRMAAKGVRRIPCDRLKSTIDRRRVWPAARRLGRWRAREAGRCSMKCARIFRPPRIRPAALAELVCSNSLKSEQENTAPWLLKEELRRLGSLLIGYHRAPGSGSGRPCADGGSRHLCRRGDPRDGERPGSSKSGARK